MIAAATPISYQLGVDARHLRRPAGKGSSEDERQAASPFGKGLAGFLPSGTYGALVDARGRILRGRSRSQTARRSCRPGVPEEVPPVARRPEPRSVHGRLRAREARSLPGGGPATRLRGGSGDPALPLEEVDDTLNDLVFVEALVVGTLIIALTALGWVVIRIGLRPLGQMERVAREIADGDLSRRVSPATPRTEIGRLGLSLNKMLGGSRRRSPTGRAARTGASGSWRMPRTNCARRWRRCAATRNCSGSVRRRIRWRSPGRWRGSRPRRRGWARWSRTCWCWRAWTSCQRWSASGRPRRVSPRARRRIRGQSPRSADHLTRRPDAAPADQTRCVRC